jgi:hypothetical protein
MGSPCFAKPEVRFPPGSNKHNVSLRNIFRTAILQYQNAKKKVLSTLKPDELLPTDFLDMSNMASPTISLAGVAYTTHLQFGTDVHFPDHARGFLYLHQPSNDPITSSIRFRCTRSNDPATFDQGKDLIRYSGQTWDIKMPSILHSRLSLFRDHLLHDGILTNDQIVHWQRSQNFPSPMRLRKSLILSTLKPDELLPSDFADMAGKDAQAFSFTGIPRDPHHPGALDYSALERFPDHARGFFYYYQPLNMPPIAASIRLRCTLSNNPASFILGEDLLSPQGIP